jgi:hypothetical protein
MRLLPLLALLFAACATRYTPSPDRPFEPIAAEFRSTHAIVLENDQPPGEEVVSGPWRIDYRAWTDVAIQITQRELQQRGMTVTADAPRRLKLAIEFATTETGWVKITSEVRLRVETGDGYRAVFTGTNSSAMAANTKRQIDGAMMRVVVAMLGDPKIVAYLTQ